jgi:hypothetical protein
MDPSFNIPKPRETAVADVSDGTYNSSFFELDGRNFYPVTQHDIVDDIMTPIDIEWDLPMGNNCFITASNVGSTQFPHQDRDENDEMVGPDAPTSIKNITDTEESSDNSSVSTDIFEEFNNIEPLASSSMDAQLFPPFSFPSSPLMATFVQSMPPLAEKSAMVAPMIPTSSSCSPFDGDYDEDDDAEDDIDAIASAQDHRFKPFHEEKWAQRYKELLVFFRENGHVAVPHTYPPNQQLARWIKR